MTNKMVPYVDNTSYNMVKIADANMSTYTMEPQYLNLLRDIKDRGTKKLQRARVNNKDTHTLSLFGAMMRHDLSQGFPLLTTKYVPIRVVAGELLWFISGSTNAAVLRDKYNINIWDEWEDPTTGELGPIYGKQWRHWDGHYDQLNHLLTQISFVRDNPKHPDARRLILSSWNPVDVRTCHAPSGCHTMAQFNITDNKLSCMVFQRSGDMFLGVPFNIASYALLTHIIAKLERLDVGDLVYCIGDAHIYSNQIDAVNMQLSRTPYGLPKLLLTFNDLYTHYDINKIKQEHITVGNYFYHPAISGVEVAV